MKLWQLASIVGDNRALLQSIASRRKEWNEFGQWYARFGQLVQLQDRSKLDYVLPNEFVLAVLTKLDKKFHRGDDGWIRSWQMSPNDEVLTAIEIYQKYGGDMLERVLEGGAVYAR